MTNAAQPMPTGQLITHATQREGQWTGGTTKAIYAYPPEKLGVMTQAQLWIGTAAITQSAPYSHFPQRTRIHLPIRGNGLHLHFQTPAETVTLTSFDQHHFPGDRPVHAELIDGRVDAFNLMFDAAVLADVSVVRSTVDSLALTLPTPPIPHAELPQWRLVYVLYAVNGEVHVALADQPAVRMAVDDAFVIEVGAAASAHGLTLALDWVTVPADLVVATVGIKV
jgi:environmental stress-induced protein Ves